jgi:hypothetical protein
MRVVVIYTLIFIQACTVIAQQTLADYSNFTPERQSIVENMGDFFDKTIRENFPAETDTASYHTFFNCFFVGNVPPESQYILHIDRKKLAEINAELFKDKNYYFFYIRYLLIPVKNSPEVPPEGTLEEYNNDSIPIIRKYVNNPEQTNIWWWYYTPLNFKGYISRLVEQHEENPLIRDVGNDMKLVRSYGVSLFVLNALGRNLREISNPVVKQLGAVIFWRYICFCGGIDLVRRKGFCDECCN